MAWPGSRVVVRPRHVTSIHRQHLRAGALNPHDLSQLDARHLFVTEVLVAQGEQSYVALGVVHGCGAPVVATFRDYLAQPKANGYAALHSDIIVHNEPHRLVLRTPKAPRSFHAGNPPPEAYECLGSHHAPPGWQRMELRALDSLIGSLRNTSHDQLLLLTPRGDVRELPVGATVLDSPTTSIQMWDGRPARPS